MEKLEKTKQCKECCRDITEDDYNAYDGYCKICYKDKEQDDDYNDDEEERKKILLHSVSRALLV